jgi:hypothetical protein
MFVFAIGGMISCVLGIHGTLGLPRITAGRDAVKRVGADF